MTAPTPDAPLEVGAAPKIWREEWARQRAWRREALGGRAGSCDRAAAVAGTDATEERTWAEVPDAPLLLATQDLADLLVPDTTTEGDPR